MLTAALFAFSAFWCQAQQKANDFTKRVGKFEGRLNSMSGKMAGSGRLNPSSAKRIKVEEWPSHYSSFGGKRFPVGDARILGSERITTTTISVETPLNDKFSPSNFKRADNESLSRRAPASGALEYKEAYYSQLDKRVDEWMDKVNNMSLADLNRYQFRRDRPSEPGFPVQRAGAGAIGDSSRDLPLQGTGLSPMSRARLPGNASGYWMGPAKASSSSPKSEGAPLSSRSSASSSWNDEDQPKRVAAPKPLFGPKTVRVQVGQ